MTRQQTKTNTTLSPADFLWASLGKGTALFALALGLITLWWMF